MTVPQTTPNVPAGKGEPAALLALASGSTIPEAAALAGVSEKTIDRRLREPAYREALTRARSEALDRAYGLLAASATTAARTLADLAEIAPSPAVRRLAAVDVLSLAVKLRESEELARRIEVLEAVHQSGGA